MDDSQEHMRDAPENFAPIDDAGTETLASLLESENRTGLIAALPTLYPADIADFIEQCTPAERQTLMELIGEDLPAESFSYLHDEVRISLLALVSDQYIARLITELESDDGIDLLEDLEEGQQNAVLAILPNHERLLYEESLSYPDDSAGRLMRREAALIPIYWTVGQAIDHLRTVDDTVPSDFYCLIIVGRDHRPMGTLPLSRLIKNNRAIPVARLMDRQLHSVRADQDQEEVSQIFRQYGIAELPVVDDSERLIGVITVDDILEVIDEEGEQDMLLMGGLSHDDFFDDLLKTLLARLPWLSINLVTAILASLVIFLFEDTLTKIVALAILMPITASMGGNAGTQTLTVAVRALATQQLTSGNCLRAIGKEIMVGVLNGAIFAIVVATLTTFWYQDVMLGMAIGGAMLLSLVIAGLAGVAVPVLLSWTRIDPAIASGVFLTTITDVVGFGAFQLLARWVLL